MAKRLFILLSIFTMVIATHATNTYAEHSVLSSGRWVKIRVSNTGVYQLTASQLSEMGFSNPSAVRLFGYNLPILPEANIENISRNSAVATERRHAAVLFLRYNPMDKERRNEKQIYTQE